MWRKDIIYSAKIKSWKISYKQGGGDLFVFGNFGKKRNLKVEIMQFPNLELLDQGHFFQSLRGGGSAGAPLPRAVLETILRYWLPCIYLLPLLELNEPKVWFSTFPF